MKRLSVLKSNRGFGIVEAMITASILAFIALAGAGIATIVQRGNDYGDRKNEQRALAGLISQNLQHSTTCDAVMGPGSGLNQKLLPVGAPTILQPSSTSATSGWPVTLKIASIKSNADMLGNTVQNGTLLPLRRLNVDGLRFADAVDLGLTGANRTYLASLFLKTSGVGSIAHKEILVGSYTIQADNLTGDIKGCQSTSSTSFQNTCTDMGCTYDSAQSPPCKCLRTQVICAAPGYVPVAFTADGLPDCRPIGGSVTCTANEFLVGVGIDWFKCAPFPSTTPAPAPICTGGATTLASSVLAAPAGCFCTAAQAWNGTSCGIAAPLCTGGASTLASSVPAAPAGCFCTAAQAWNGTSCGIAALLCTGGATTTFTTVVAAPTGCYCAAGDTWAAGSCTAPVPICAWVRTAMNDRTRTDNIVSHMPGHRVLALLKTMADRLPVAGACTARPSPSCTYGKYSRTMYALRGLAGLCIGTTASGSIPAPPAISTQVIGTRRTYDGCTPTNNNLVVPGIVSDTCWGGDLGDGTQWTCQCP